MVQVTTEETTTAFLTSTGRHYLEYHTAQDDTAQPLGATVEITTTIHYLDRTAKTAKQAVRLDNSGAVVRQLNTPVEEAIDGIADFLNRLEDERMST